MTRRMLKMLAVVGVIAALLIGWHIFTKIMIGKAMMAMAEKTQTVSTASIGYEEWQKKLDLVGSVRAAKGSDIAIEVPGVVSSIQFDSSSDVKTGDVLIQIKADEDNARLQALTAAAELARITFERDVKLLEAQAISQAQYDADAANLASTRAQKDAQKAVLDKKTIRAPFSGSIGLRLVDVGQYVTPGTIVTTLQQLDPVYVDFNLPEQTLAQIKRGQKITVKVDAHPDQSFEGEILAINPKVDIDTRNVQVRASFKNPDRLLVPGMFARGEVFVGESQKHLTVPQTAITYNPYGDTVYVVEEKVVEGKEKKEGDAPRLAVRQTFVKLGETRGDQVSILEGLKEGDVVVIAGQMKLRNGSLITINNAIVPTNDPNPAPSDN